MSWVFVYPNLLIYGITMHYLVYIDEFGHIGPYLSYNHPQYNTHPVFGIGGIAIPVEKVRSFSTYFFKLKNKLLKFELDRSNTHPAKWEKKGSSLYTVKNINKYIELRKATFRLINLLNRIGAFVIYVGVEKNHTVDEHYPNKLYQAVFRELIKRLNEECEQGEHSFQLLLDESEDLNYQRLIETAAVAMFGGEEPKKYLIEPPVQLKSHLYQTMQAADWICGLIGRLTKYELEPENFPDYECFRSYFKDRFSSVCKRSGIRKLPVEQIQ